MLKREKVFTKAAEVDKSEAIQGAALS